MMPKMISRDMLHKLHIISYMYNINIISFGMTHLTFTARTFQLLRSIGEDLKPTSLP